MANRMNNNGKLGQYSIRERTKVKIYELANYFCFGYISKYYQEVSSAPSFLEDSTLNNFFFIFHKKFKFAKKYFFRKIIRCVRVIPNVSYFN